MKTKKKSRVTMAVLKRRIDYLEHRLAVALIDVEAASGICRRLTAIEADHHRARIFLQGMTNKAYSAPNPLELL